MKHALAMAQLEAQIGVKATYFFMTTSNTYNLLSEHNVKIAKSIDHWDILITFRYHSP